MSSTATIRTHDSLKCRRTPAGRSAPGSRHQYVSVLEILTLVMIGALLIVGVLASGPHDMAPGSTGVVLVEAGDTLWSIAKAHPVVGLTTAQAAELIATKNHVSHSPLNVGSSLLVPVSEERGPAIASR